MSERLIREQIGGQPSQGSSEAAAFAKGEQDVGGAPSRARARMPASANVADLMDEFRTLVKLLETLGDWDRQAEGLKSASAVPGSAGDRDEKRRDAISSQIYERIADIGWRVVEAEAGDGAHAAACAEILLHLCEHDPADLTSRLTVLLGEHVVGRDRGSR